MSEIESEQDSQPLNGADYSLFLVRYTQERLHEGQDNAPTHEQIAEHLGATTEMVKALLQGERRTFGTEFFKRIAAQENKALWLWLRDLIVWEMDLRQ